MSKRTVIRSLGSLEKAKLLVIEARPNKSNLYKLQGCQIDRGCQRVTSVVSESHLRGDRESPKPVRNQLVTSNTTPKDSGESSKQAEDIYSAYPRKVSKPAALTAIRKAIKREAAKKDLGMAPAALLAKTRLWATACQQRIAAEPDAAKYVKHPATWFNQQCYLEPASEWGIKAKPKSLETKLNDELIRASERELEATRKLIESL